MCNSIYIERDKAPDRLSGSQKFQRKEKNMTTLLEKLKASNGDYANVEQFDDVYEQLAEISTAQYYDGCDNTLFVIDGLGVIHSGAEGYLVDLNSKTALEHLKMWDFDDMDFNQLCASFDVTPDITPASSNDTNVKIWIEWNYYYGVGNPTNCYLTDDDGYEALIFDTVEQAQAKIDELERETYYLSHNEAGRPRYTIVA